MRAITWPLVTWSPAMGSEDALYKKVEQLVHRVLAGLSATG